MTDTTFLEYIIGTTNYPLYAAEWVFALMGVFLSLRLHVKTRDVNSKNTPKEFSWRFLFFDNIPRLITTLILIFIFIRFPEYLLQIQLVADNKEILLVLALLLGFYNDRLAQILKNLNLFGLSAARKSIQNETDPNGPAGNSNPQ